MSDKHERKIAEIATFSNGKTCALNKDGDMITLRDIMRQLAFELGEDAIRLGRDDEVCCAAHVEAKARALTALATVHGRID